MLDFLFKRRQPLPLPYKREIHCHIIPGVDDGSVHIDFSVEYLRFLESVGVERIVFTPHHTYPKFMNTVEEVQPIYDRLVGRMQKEGLKIVPEGFSFEYRMDKTFLALQRAGAYGTPGCQLRPLLGRYILIENAWQQSFAQLDELVDTLGREGWYPIMAHPERYPYWQKRRDQYVRLQDSGLEFQCNILSFAGYYGDAIRQTACWMLREGYVNYIGSDLHNRHHVELIHDFLRTRRYGSMRDDMVASIGNDKMQEA